MKTAVVFENETQEVEADAQLKSFIRVTAPASDDRQKPIRRVIMADCSGSMAYPHGDVSKLAALQNAIVELIAAAKPGDQIGLVQYHNTAGVISENLLENHNLRGLTSLLRPNPKGNTNTWAGIEVARELDPNATLILVSDGESNTGMYVGDQLVDACVELGVPICTVGLGNDANARELGDIARRTKGYFGMSFCEVDLANALAACLYDGSKRYGAKLEVKANRGVKLALECDDPDWHVSPESAWTAIRDMWPGQSRLFQLTWNVRSPRTGAYALGTIRLGSDTIPAKIKFGAKTKRNEEGLSLFADYARALAVLSVATWAGSSTCIMGTGMHGSNRSVCEIFPAVAKAEAGCSTVT